ncbi:MAG: hypothetical protein IPM29_25705 [Planctomycetes bacterium]|nr:hypothetical protein [Planctomycetota bacterium]
MNPTHRSLVFGWWSLACWLALGMALEALHGFKVGWYLDVANEARRLQWNLAHAHGTLIALANIAFAATIRPRAGAERLLARASACLRWAGVLMPVGFLLGGAFAMGADPGYAVALVPIGGVLLFAGVVQAARVAAAAESTSATPDAPAPTLSRAERRRKS